MKEKTNLGKCTAGGRHAAIGGQGRGGRGMTLQSAGLFLGCFGVNGHDPGGFELGQVQSELVLHAGEGGGCQTVTTDVLRTDRRKLRDPGFGHWFRTSRATGRGREEEFYYLQQMLIQSDSTCHILSRLLISTELNALPCATQPFL